MATTLRPVADSPSELRFAHPHGAALVWGIAAAAGAWAAWTFIGESTPRLVFTGAVGFFALVGLGAGLYRYELALDLAGRRWRRRKGFAVVAAADAGSLDDLRAVVLTLRWVSQGSGNSRRTVPRWTVSLELEGPAWSGPVGVGTTDGEAAAYRLQEEYARRLRVDAVDRTGDEEVRRAWDGLDVPLADAPSGDDPGAETRGGLWGVVTGAPPAAPPAGAGIDVSVVDGLRRVTLPPLGANIGVAFLVLFGLVFAGGGGMAMAAGLGLLGEVTVNGTPTTGPVPMLAGMGGLFALVGTAIAAAGLVGGMAREWVADERHRLLFGVSGLGRTWRRREMPKRAVEEVSLRASTEARHRKGGALRVGGVRVGVGGETGSAAEEVRIRSDDDIVRLGKHLPPEAKAWLRDAVAAMVRG